MTHRGDGHASLGTASIAAHPVSSDRIVKLTIMLCVRMTTALLTDRYELSMLSSVVESGMARQRAVFEVFARRLPHGRRFGLLAGTGRFLEALADFTVDADTLAWLVDHDVVTSAGAAYLDGWTFRGDIIGYREGDLYWPGSPVLTVRCDLADGFLLETLALSIFNHDTAVASAAARMVLAAGGRPIIEMGSRRVDPDAAVAGARAAYLAGFSHTSNLQAGRRYGVPTTGTAAHAFTLAHRSEVEAFERQIACHGVGTTLLVDTYDIGEGIRNAVKAANAAGACGPGAIRIDSGDLLVEARKARDLLDSLGAAGTRIVTTSDLDEYTMTELAAAPVDGYGVGSRVATGSGHPSAGFVYKLVAIAHSAIPGTALSPVEKRAVGKGSAGGEKTAYRSADGQEHYTVTGDIPDGAQPLQVTYVSAGEPVTRAWPTLAGARALAADSLAGLDAHSRAVADGQPNRACTRKDQP